MEESERIGFYSIGINTLLVEIKYGLAVFSGSIALAADAIHSLSDIISSVTVLVGIKISKRKSEIFPYDLYKVENLVSSLFIFFAGYEIAVSVFLEEQKLNIDGFVKSPTSVRQAVRQAHGPEQSRRTHGPEQGRRTHGPEQSRRTALRCILRHCSVL